MQDWKQFQKDQERREVESEQLAASLVLHVLNEYERHPDCNIMDFYFALKTRLREEHCLECKDGGPGCQCQNDE